MFVIPIEGKNPLRHKPWAVYALIVLNTIFFIPVPCSSAMQLKDFFARFGFTPASPHVINLFTSMFVHGGFMHILGNMWFLLIFGDNVEDVLGSGLFLLIYFLGGLGATGLHYVFSTNSAIPCVGASGAISAVVGMYAIFFPKVKAKLLVYFWRFKIREIQTTAYVAISVWFLEQTALGLILHMINGLRAYIPIAFWAHVGGLICGVIFGFLFVGLGYMQRFRKKARRHAIFGYA